MKKLEEGKMFLLSEIFLETFVIAIVNLGRLLEIFILRVKPSKMNDKISEKISKKGVNLVKFLSVSQNMDFN